MAFFKVSTPWVGDVEDGKDRWDKPIKKKSIFLKNNYSVMYDRKYLFSVNTERKSKA